MLRPIIALYALVFAGAAVAAPPSAPSIPIQVAPSLVTTGSQYYPTWGDTSLLATSVAPSQNTARCAPFWANYAFHTDLAVISVSTLGTGPLNFALYTDAVDVTTHLHRPQTLVTNPGVTFTVTSTGVSSASLGTAGTGVPVSNGLNWVCFNDTNASDAVRYAGISTSSTLIASLVGSSNSGFVSAAASQLNSFTIAETAGTTTTNWPSFVGASFTESNSPSVPHVSLRVASVP